MSLKRKKTFPAALFFICVALCLFGCSQSHENQYPSKPECLTEGLEGIAGSVVTAEYELRFDQGAAPAGSVLFLELPGITYPDMTSAAPKITATFDGESLPVGPGDSDVGCTSPSRSFYKVPISIPKPWTTGQSIKVKVENYRLPFKAAAGVGAKFRLSIPSQKNTIDWPGMAGTVFPNEPIRLFIDGPATVQEGEPILLRVVSVDAFGNPYLGMSFKEVSSRFKGQPLILEINGERPEREPIFLNEEDQGIVKIPNQGPGVYRFSLILGEEEVGRSGPVVVTKQSQKTHRYWGDLHSHTGFSDGYTTVGPGNAFKYAKDAAHLDFAAVTDHAEAVWGCPLTEAQWKEIQKQAAGFNEPGKFVSFLGFEWTGSFPWDKNWPVHDGHANVVFPDQGAFCRADANDCNTFEKLLKKTKEFHPLVIRHHTCADWAPVTFPDKVHESMPVLEVTSSHGNCECPDCPGAMPDRALEAKHYIQTALLSGFHYGLVGGSDNHHARPGSRNFPDMEPMVLNAGGLTCVMAEELTRQGIMNALQNRRCYATTSTRIYLNFRLADKPMGSTLPAGTKVRGMFEVHGTAPIKELVIWRGDIEKKSFSKLVKINPNALDVKEPWTDLSPPTKGLYYLRVLQEDGEMAWSSPIWIQ